MYSYLGLALVIQTCKVQNVREEKKKEKKQKNYAKKKFCVHWI